MHTMCEGGWGSISSSKAPAAAGARHLRRFAARIRYSELVERIEETTRFDDEGFIRMVAAEEDRLSTFVTGKISVGRPAAPLLGRFRARQ